MEPDAREPPVLARRRYPEPADRSLSSDLVAAEQVHRERPPTGAVRAGPADPLLAPLASGARPCPPLAGRDVDVADLPAKLRGRRVSDVGHYLLGPEVPALKHGDARADVADGDRQVKDALVLVDPGLAALHPDPVPVREHHLLGGVLEPPVHQERPPPLLKRLFGDASRAV